MSNVDNYFEQTSGSDNAFVAGGTSTISGSMDVSGTMDITGTWQIDGVTVTATAAEINEGSTVMTVANKTGVKINKGNSVYISGYDATLDAPTITKAVANDQAKVATHVVTADILDGATGTVDAEAVVTGLDTSTFSAVGSLVYLDASAAGAYESAAPTDADEITQVIGVVKVKNATTGEISFFPGYRFIVANRYLNNQTPGTQVANGSVIADANVNTGVSKVTELHIGASGSEVQVTATPAEINELSNGELSFTVIETVSQAEINAGKVIITGVAGKSIAVTEMYARTVDGWNTGTSIDLESETSTEQVWSLSQTAISGPTVLAVNEANTTTGAYFIAPLTAGEGLQAIKKGSDFTAATNIVFAVTYRLV